MYRYHKGDLKNRRKDDFRVVDSNHEQITIFTRKPFRLALPLSDVKHFWFPSNPPFCHFLWCVNFSTFAGRKALIGWNFEFVRLILKSSRLFPEFIPKLRLLPWQKHKLQKKEIIIICSITCSYTTLKQFKFKCTFAPEKIC